MSVATPDQELVEREPELAALRGVLARLEGGEGGIVVVEAPAGHGKTALLRALRADAQAAGVRVLRAAGAELERDFPFGIVRQLLEPALRACDERRRAELFEGAAQLAEPVFAGHAEADTGDASFGRLHGLYWLTANLAEAEPLVLVVDDAHWADAPSMRYLDVLARRLEGLPVVLAIGAREAEPGAQQEVLDDLVGAPEALVLRPRPLSGAAVGEILEQALGDGVETAFAAVAAHSTGGNPLLVRELLRTVAEEGFAGRSEEAERLREALPANVGRIVIGRLRRLSPDALALARAVAVLGDGARFADAAELAEVAAQDATAAHGALVRAGLLDAGELRFVHPVVRSAVHADLTGGLRGDWHRRAAALRAGAGAGASEVAAHLVQTEPGGEPWAAETLAAAGRRALLDGAPDVALRHLRRALAEPPEPAARPAVLLALGHAAARAGAPDAA
ncbi:MAG TPA: AAA family ATPase, partial [Solirubrobacteraceae bacterium]